MAARIPPLLEPYLSLPPEASLILLTSVLEASTNWLVLRFLHSALVPDPERGPGSKIVLVSFLRDFAFWKDGAKRLGLDLSKLTIQKQFIFLDGLSELFLPESKHTRQDEEVVGVLRSTELRKVYKDITDVVESFYGGNGERSSEKVILVIDCLDLLLAAGEKDINAVSLGEMLLDLREHVHATILTLSGDMPLVLRQHTPLEMNHAAFLISVAHQAHLIMNLRLLDTGTARDVSGVIRIIDRGGSVNEDGISKIEGKELLYFVVGDGNVKVFERGH